MDQKQHDDRDKIELKEWETPQLVAEDVKTVTRGGGRYPVFGREDVVGTYYLSS